MAKDLPELNIGETIRLQPDQNHPDWRKAKMVDKVGPRSYLVETEDGSKISQEQEVSSNNRREI